MIVELLKEERNQRYQDSPFMRDDFEEVEGLEVKEEHLRCCQAKGLNDEEKVGDEEVVVGEGVVMISSSLGMLTNSCLGGIMVNLIFLKGLDEEAFVEFMVEWCEEDEDDDRNKEDGLFN
nr:hypothetical protein [Tanacetum cinerariifolium]